MRFKEDMKEVLNLISRLKSVLPKTSIKGEEETEMTTEKEEVYEEVEQSIPATEIDKLKSDLKDIENKLNALS